MLLDVFLFLGERARSRSFRLRCRVSRGSSRSSRGRNLSGSLWKYPRLKLPDAGLERVEHTADVSGSISLQSIKLVCESLVHLVKFCHRVRGSLGNSPHSMNLGIKVSCLLCPCILLGQVISLW